MLLYVSTYLTVYLTVVLAPGEYNASTNAPTKVSTNSLARYLDAVASLVRSGAYLKLLPFYGSGTRLIMQLHIRATHSPRDLGLTTATAMLPQGGQHQLPG